MIRGWFDPRAPQPLPRVTVGVWITGITFVWTPVEFMIDTGAGATLLHPRDSQYSVGISRSDLSDSRRWAGTVTYTGVGGDVTYFVTPVRYRFQHHDGRLQHIDGTINVAPVRPDNRNVPSLLGWDVLSQFEVVMNWTTKTVELRDPTI